MTADGLDSMTEERVAGELVADLPTGEERTRLLARLAVVLASLPSQQPQTWRLTEALRRLLGADGAALTVEYHSPSRTTVCTTDRVAEGLENVQEVLAQGPGYEAAAGDEVVTAHLDAQQAERWPMLAQAVAEQFGPLSMYAIPVHAHSEQSGILTLYTRPRTRLREPLLHAQFLANAIAPVLLMDFQQHEQLDGGLSGAWNTRAVVHQATGMVMAQVPCTPHDALALLQGHAYAQQSDIYQIATGVVEQRLDFSRLFVEGD